MFWFRTTDFDGTLLANGKAENELGAKKHFRFSLEGGALNLQLSGQNIPTSVYANDGQWHHAALTISRSRNVGCLYLDQKLRNTFAVDTIGGIDGNMLAAGATYVDDETIEDPITGNIDEIAMMEMALPESGIKSFSSTTPTGKEMGLLTYLSFSQSERQSSNEMRLMPSGVSLKRYKDTATGEWTTQRDTVVAQADIDRLYDRTLYAPMHDNQEMENIKFSYVADGKDLLINLDVPEANIEKTNVYVIVKEVADLQGNLMASPAMLDLYVYRNPLRWADKRLTLTSTYGEEYSFTATIKNLSGRSQRYTLEGLPIWMTASQTSGSVGSLDEETITFTISQYINVGNFTETIYLVGEDGMSEPLPLNIKVRGNAPDWAVSETLKHENITMYIIGQVEIDGRIMNDPDDRIAVFDENHELLGVANLEATGNEANTGLAYLTVYSHTHEPFDLYYEFYDASAGNIYSLMTMGDDITFKADTIVGTTEDPCRFSTNNGKVQQINLKAGWNWISFNLEPNNQSTLGELLNKATQWEVGDGLEIVNADGTTSQHTYKAYPNREDPKNPIYAWDESDKVISIDPRLMYRFYSKSDKTAYYEPFIVQKGWNRIGYMSRLNLPLGTALAEYTDKASAGDIIKSQSEFAVLSVDASGNKTWNGTLTYMRAGEGYMLKHIADNEITFYYPIYVGSSRYSGFGGKKNAPLHVNTSGTSMTVVAKADGIEVQPGDRLSAWRGAELCGVSVANEHGVFYLNVGDAEMVPTKDLIFTLERDEEIIASTDQRQMQYVPNAAHGTPDEPAAIRFVGIDSFSGDGWYTLSGIRLSKRPTQQGVYIHNKEKVIIK